MSTAHTPLSENNHTGMWLEQLVENEARARGIPVRDYSAELGNGDLYQPNVLVRRVPYTSIYGACSTSEFVLRWNDHSVRIECRVQETSGSVDEKFPYLFQNARDRMPEPEVHLLLYGDGARVQAVEWLKRQCRQVDTKVIRVFTFSEWRAWIKATTKKGGPA